MHRWSALVLYSDLSGDVSEMRSLRINPDRVQYPHQLQVNERNSKSTFENYRMRHEVNLLINFKHITPYNYGITKKQNAPSTICKQNVRRKTTGFSLQPMPNISSMQPFTHSCLSATECSALIRYLATAPWCSQRLKYQK